MLAYAAGLALLGAVYVALVLFTSPGTALLFAVLALAAMVLALILTLLR